MEDKRPDSLIKTRFLMTVSLGKGWLVQFLGATKPRQLPKLFESTLELNETDTPAMRLNR